MIKNRILNDWAPETRSLLKSLTDAGFTLVEGNNGEDRFKFDGSIARFIEDLTATDEATLYVKAPGEAKQRDYALYLVYGNEPGVLVSDYTVNPLLDTVTQAHYDKWSEREQPTKLAPLSRGELFENEVEVAVIEAIGRAKADGAVAMSADNLWQGTRVKGTVNAPAGTNAAYYARQVFDRVISRQPFCQFIIR